MSTEMDGVTVNGYTYGSGFEKWAATTGRGLEAEVNGWMKKAQGLEQKVTDLEDRLDAAERALKQARQIADDAIATIRRGRA